ncbi:BrnT family toxin [Orrella sp. 11846]|uniref:BrnT family toxin n=1 Tax=Orrella sp. 11846 TaxID=3409913 RepID=UPI003B5BCD1E
MDITYDPAKNSKNIAERGLSFDMVSQFDFDTAHVYADTRKDYGETRYIAVGYIEQRLYVVVFTATEAGLRIISLRKANKREVKAYEQR